MGGLTTAGVRAAIKPDARPGRHTDTVAKGLCLVVTPERRAWVLRVQTGGRRREFGLGSASEVSLADARTKANALRKQVREGVDPTEAKRTAAKAATERAGRTFRVAAERLHASLEPTFRNSKHAAQWVSTLRAHAFPAFGEVPVDAVTGAMVIDALEPIWLRTPETARRVRQRIGAVLAWAHAREWRDRVPDLSALTGKALPKQSDKGGHHAAVDYRDAPAVLDRLRGENPSTGRMALLFLIYTAARSGEVRGARWGEIDLEAATWTVPGSRMKMGKEHSVPLSGPALAILETMAMLRRRVNDPDEIIFASARGGPLSDMTLLKPQKLVAPDTTPHGWRSAFRDWAGETTGFASDVLEACLAHAVGDKVRVAYQRGTMFDKRAEVMAAWAGYLAALPADVARLDPRRRGGVAA